MKSQDPSDVAARLEMGFELYQLGVDMLRTRLRREHPAMTEAEIDERVNAWLARRPGAESGDAEGRPVELPRRRA